MKTKHNLLTKTAGALLMGSVMILSACTGQFAEYNTDPNRATPEDLEKDMLALGGMFPTMMVDVVPTSDVDANEYQRAQNLTGDIFSGYMAAIGTWNSSSNNSTYNLDFGDWNEVGFKVAYRLMGAWSQIHTKAEETKQYDAIAVADILKVMIMHRICDNHGPIPYSKMLASGVAMEYDSQKDVYMAFFTELNAAIAELTEFVQNSPEARPLRKFDLIYGGDYSKWVKFANSLKLRLAMRIVYAEPELAKKYAEEAVNHSLGVITDNKGNALLQSALGIPVYNPLTVCWERYKETRMGASMESFMMGYNDPRVEKYFQKITKQYDASKPYTFHGVRNGVVIGGNQTYYQQYASSPNVQANTPIIWMTASEIYFLRAEGALRGWNMGGTAQAMYEEGVKVSFEQHGVSASYTTYINDDTAQPANYGGFLKQLNPVNATTDIKIKWDNTAVFEKNLERIMTQKWLAMYPQGQEAWSELRRTGYPKIFPVVKNNSKEISTQMQVRRIPFTKPEKSTNPDGVAKAVELLGGPDTGATRVWWDKNPNIK